MMTNLDDLSDEEYFALCRQVKKQAEGGGALTNEELVAEGAVDTTPQDEGIGVIITKTGVKNG